MSFREDDVDFAEEAVSVRTTDPPGILSSLRTLARAMLSLIDAPDVDAPRTEGDRRMKGALAKSIYLERRRRDEFFSRDLFGEPAWDILLDLFAAGKVGELRSIKASCIAANVPEATALRYNGKLVDSRLAERLDDKTDGRRKFLRLTQSGCRRMEDYVSSIPPLGDQGADVIRYLVRQE